MLGFKPHIMNTRIPKEIGALNMCTFWKYESMKEQEFSVKSLKERRDRRIDPSMRKLSIKSSLAHRTSEPILKSSVTSFHLSNFEKI